MSRHCLNNMTGDPVRSECEKVPFEDGTMCRACGCHLCGGIVLADTEEWPHPLCASCFEDLGPRFENNKKWVKP